ncbi:transcriptional regulator, TetR family [Lentzea xinjiangensis]|uniref:Transcriptional regulator, TetR family n=1 Tax=Lentzea xinjiangensis TaxID=402600 RepID=A0A1H9K1M0_9PSEU|nr:TetR/AcrR family transcriptional regulator [Lentzea xinjiangensis]SEQ92803.1 transcriptional regulator, TetR family [Lentzea xinjiangensis]
MSASTPHRPVRADAERNVARILEAAKVVLAEDPTASLERIADEAGLARATVHRRFASRKALLEALVAQLNEQYLRALHEAKVDSAPPLIALHRVTELVMEIKFSHRLVMDVVTAGTPARWSYLSAEVRERAELLFARLHASGAITAAHPSWCLKIYLAILDEVHHLPAGAPELASCADEVTARTTLQVTTVLGALGGAPLPH